MNARMKLLIATFSGLLIFFFFTNPETLPSVVLVVPFVLIFTFLALVFKTLVDKTMRRRNTAITLLFSGFVVVLLALQTLGQLTLRDIIMVTALFCVAFLYIYRRSTVAS
jgi:quinol-cytochrome oxidoreductase complex cytochrome b subunit